MLLACDVVRGHLGSYENRKHTLADNLDGVSDTLRVPLITQSFLFLSDILRQTVQSDRAAWRFCDVG